ncbi:MAG: ParB/RepB/Spo0J family partition protein [Clostridia bacterium]|nr:ParB/RepB/Spo0J family partition protein [Clostridia bacterium]
MMAKKALGRDFYSLLDDNMIEGDAANKTILTLKIGRVSPRSDQPRKNFDENALQILADSIREHGVIQPIAVRELGAMSENYEIIAGERRWRAAKMAGLDEIPAIILTGDDLKIAEISLIENIQRQDLNPIEEALAYKALIERFGLKQEEVARQVGKSRSAVANMLRLLELPDDVLNMVQDGKLSMGHARAILGLTEEEKMLPLAQMTVERELSVREVETLVRKYNTVEEEIPEADEDHTATQRRIYMKELEDRTRTALGRKVKIHETPRKKTVELSFEDDEDLENLLKTLAGQDFFD